MAIIKEVQEKGSVAVACRRGEDMLAFMNIAHESIHSANSKGGCAHAYKLSGRLFPVSYIFSPHISNKLRSPVDRDSKSARPVFSAYTHKRS